MKTPTIAKLETNDIVSDANGVLGKVVRFVRDAVVIEWDDVGERHYSDADLRGRGVVLVEGSR